ncbi:MAG TPA: glycosyltransferase family 4 protein [Rhabdochlamydiaceae bacterium]|jgi:UDP-glucose:(heptosyl)LPS alpha-1,3-glucosyltransferase|nr:glycosyltransferase family 4 protein [Rhabdochlamydiaceae bacterium]
MKTVAILKKDFHNHGGLEKSAWRIIQALKERGASPTLLTSLEISAPCPVLSCSLDSKFKFIRLKEFDTWCKSMVKRHHFDVVFSMDRATFQTHHRAGNGVHAAYLALRSQKEGFLKKFSFKLNPLHRVMLKLEKATFEDPHLKGIIVNSHYVKNQVLQFYATDPAKIHVVHNGVEWLEMENDFNLSFSHKEKIAKELGLDPKVFQFLFVGHNFHRKGVSLLLKALSSLPRNFHLSVVGTDKNLSAYQKQAAELGLAKNVTFFYSQSDTRPFYQVTDALVIPSHYDPFANVTVEALAMGLFVVSSDNNGGHEVLTPDSGITVDPFDLKRFAAALETALRHPKTLPSAKKIRASVEHLDFSRQLEKVCQICLS